MTTLSFTVGDITQIEVDAVVNAANEWMLGGGGVDGAIHAAAGPKLLEACKGVPEIKPGVRCPVGEARITPAFLLPAKHIIHTVGPRWRGGTNGEPETLALCYRACLTLAIENRVSSIAFPAISTGAFAYPLLPACRVAVSACLKFVETSTSLSKIVFVAFGREGHVTYRKTFNELGLRHNQDAFQG